MFGMMVLALAFVGAGAGAAEPETALSLEELTRLPLEQLLEVQVSTIASGTKKTVPKAPAIASIITSQDIAEMGATSLEEALASVPGLHVSRSGDLYSTKFQFRGLSTFHNPEALVMINGIPIVELVRGNRGLHSDIFPVKMISRIEVIRGPGSALYGADAYSGVINIVTRTASDFQGTEAGGRIGSFDSKNAWLLHSSSADGWKAAFMADFGDTEGHRRQITEDAQSQRDASVGTSASLAPGPVNLSQKVVSLMMDLERSRWRLRGSFHGRSNQGTGQGVSQALDPSGLLSGGRTLLELTYHDEKAAENWDLTSQLVFLHHSQGIDRNALFFPPGADLGSGVFPEGLIANPEYSERQLRFDNSAFYTGFAGHRIRLGAGYTYGHVYEVRLSANTSPTFAPLPGLTDLSDTPSSFLPEKSRLSFHAYSQDEWKLFEAGELTLGVRYDHFSDFGGTLNPRAAFVWQLSPALTAKALYGRAFRAPSMLELYSANNPFRIGNPDLKPEVIDVIEVAWAWKIAESLHAGLNLFHYEANDQITFVASGVTATAQNLASQIGNGFELEARFMPSARLDFHGNYSFQYSKDHVRDQPSGIVPNHQAYLRGNWSPLSSWELGAQLLWVGARKREPVDSRPPLDGYTTLDLILRRTLGPLGVMASVRNLFDSDVREPSTGPSAPGGSAAIPGDLPQAPRSAYGELSYRF